MATTTEKLAYLLNKFNNLPHLTWISIIELGNKLRSTAIPSLTQATSLLAQLTAHEPMENRVAYEVVGGEGNYFILVNLGDIHIIEPAISSATSALSSSDTSAPSARDASVSYALSSTDKHTGSSRKIMHSLLSAHTPMPGPFVDITYSYLFNNPLPPRMLPQEIIDITCNYLFPEDDNDIKKIFRGNKHMGQSSSSYFVRIKEEILQGAKEVAHLTEFFASKIPKSVQKIVAGTEYSFSYPSGGRTKHENILIIREMVKRIHPIFSGDRSNLTALEQSFYLDSYPVAAEPREIAKTIEETEFTVTSRHRRVR